MKRSGRLLLALAALALLFLIRPALVEGPAVLCPEETAAEKAPAPVLRAAEGMPFDMAAAASTETVVVRRFFRPVQEVMADAACVRVADRNGYPLTGRTYVRTVYAACPLQDMPG